MITRRTVFVLGAGASYPYGFPTGEELVDEIVALPQRTSSPELLMMEGDSADDVNRFVQDLADSDDPSVDSFLEYRPNYLKIGKLAIAMCLVNKELDRTLSRKYRKQSNNPRGHLAWYHYLWQEMAAPKDQFGKNAVAFVTLNYDRSIERYFFRALKAKHNYENDQACLKDLYGVRFVHVYGSLGDAHFSEHPYGRSRPSQEEIRKTAARLNIIHEDLADSEELSQALGLLKEAEVVCFLGYGFHELNNERLTLTTMATDKQFEHQKWFASRYGVTDIEFRRRTGRFFNRFLDGGYSVGRVGEEGDGALEVLRKLPVI